MKMFFLECIELMRVKLISCKEKNFIYNLSALFSPECLNDFLNVVNYINVVVSDVFLKSTFLKKDTIKKINDLYIKEFLTVKKTSQTLDVNNDSLETLEILGSMLSYFLIKIKEIIKKDVK